MAAASCAGVFLASLVLYTFPVLLKPLSVEFAWSREEVSFAIGLLAVMSAVSSAPLGYLLDRLGPRRILVPCVIVFACGFASMSLLTHRLWQLYATFAVLGMALTGLSPIAYARAISTWFERRRGLALALAISGASIGTVAHPPVMQALIRSVGWRAACLSLGIFALAVGLMVVVPFIRARPSAGGSTPGPTGSESRSLAGSVGQAVRSRVFWILMVVLFCASAAQNGTTVHLVALLTDRGVSAGQAAIALSSMGIANIIGRLATGWLIDRLFAARVSFALLVIVGLGAIVLSDAQSLAMGVVAAILIGIGMGGESDITPYLLSRYFALESFSTLYGFAWIATASGGALGPVLMGRAFDDTGSYESLLVILGAVIFGAAMLMLALPRYPAIPVRTGASARTAAAG